MILNGDFFAKPLVNINRRLEIQNRYSLFVAVVVVRGIFCFITTTPSRFILRIDGNLNSSHKSFS